MIEDKQTEDECMQGGLYLCGGALLKFLFEPKIFEFNDGRHGYTCVPCNSIHDKDLDCIPYMDYQNLIANNPDSENC